MSELNTLFQQNGAQFAVDLLQMFAADSDFKKNFIFSPFSIQCCMALLFAGSSGETANELIKGLRLVSNAPEEVAQAFQTVLQHFKQSKLLKIGNKVYVKDSCKLSSKYEQDVKKKYLSEVENINFAENEKSTEKINQWVSKITAGKITNLISADALNQDTAAVLLNAIHFKGQWQSKFNEKATTEDEFWIEPNKSVKMQFMRKKADFFVTKNDALNCSILEMPYKNSDLSMLVLLPKERDGLKELVSKLRDINFVDLTKNMHKREIIVKFPKFKVDFSVDLKQTLEQLGISQIFAPEAELNKMLETAADMFVSKIVHKAVIEVNEEGTEAAAATGAVMMMCSMRRTFEFTADHPFLYLIWNRKNILFGGALMGQPLQ